MLLLGHWLHQGLRRRGIDMTCNSKHFYLVFRVIGTKTGSKSHKIVSISDFLLLIHNIIVIFGSWAIYDTLKRC